MQGLVTRRINKLKSKELNHIFSNSDIILLTETWTNELSDLHYDGFQSFVLHRTLKKANAKRDSGGIAIFIRDKYVSSDTLIFEEEDDILWVKISGNLFNLDKDLYICLSYVLPDGSSRQSMVETNIFDRLLNSVVYVDNVANENVGMWRF